MDRIPWIGLRVPPEQESIGTDLALMGELAYRYETNVPIKRPTTAQISPAEVEMEKTKVKTPTKGVEEPLFQPRGEVALDVGKDT
jgi:hypothetical protein